MDGIYELYNGDYIDLSKLVAVKVEYQGMILPDDAEWTTSGIWFIEGNFEFIKNPVKFYDTKKVKNNEDLKKRETFINNELQNVIKNWRKYKESKK